MFKRYTRETDVVYAEQWLGDNHGEIQDLFPSDWKAGFATDDSTKNLDLIFTRDFVLFKFTKGSESWGVATFGDWIVRSGDDDPYFTVLSNDEKLVEVSDAPFVGNTDRGALVL